MFIAAPKDQFFKVISLSWWCQEFHLWGHAFAYRVQTITTSNRLYFSHNVVLDAEEAICPP